MPCASSRKNSVSNRETLPVLIVDRREQRNGRNYFVLQGYNLVITDPVQKTGHTATWGWFFVDAKTGTAYEWNLAQDRLVKL
jgi:hypothetical protein